MTVLRSSAAADGLFARLCTAQITEKNRDDRLLDPATERAKIRAMYTHPSHTNRGIGRMIINASEVAARARGFKSIEMAASAAGKPFYLKCGYVVEREWLDERKGREAVPLALVSKALE